MELTGEWTLHATYGEQFRVNSCNVKEPTSLRGMERYLGSGLIKGVGPATARLLVQKFGKDTFDVIANQPEKLKGIKGMGKKRWKQVSDSFREQQSAREAMVFLQTYGIPPNLSVKISKLYGDRTAAVIRENPYRLCQDLDGVGFTTADRIGIAVGIAPDSPFRIQAALIYQLTDAAAGNGHIFLFEGDLVKRTALALRLEEGLISEGLRQLVLHRDLVLAGDENTRRVYLPRYDAAEKEVAQRLCELMLSADVEPSGDTDAEITMFEAQHRITFSEKQREAIRTALHTGVLVITGGPGTGKTTIINCIIQLLKKDHIVLLCAPTGRAAKRMTEATGTLAGQRLCRRRADAEHQHEQGNG